VKMQGSTSPMLALAQALCFTETSYMAWSKLQQSSAISFLHTEVPSLFCMRNKNKSSSLVQELWCETVPWWMFSRLP
jgi:hypothetical protein